MLKTERSVWMLWPMSWISKHKMREILKAMGKTLIFIAGLTAFAGADAGLTWLNWAGYYWTVGIILFVIVGFD